MPVLTTLRLAAPAVTLLLLLATTVLFLLNYGAEARFIRHMVNSDALFLPVLFADLLDQGGRLSDWLLTPALYFFPDYPLYLAAHLTAPDIYARIATFALVQMALVFVLVRAILARFTARPATAAALALLGLCVLGFSGRLSYVYLFVSAHHYGIFLAALALVALWLWPGPLTDWRDRSLAARWAILMLSFLTALSDALFLAQFVAPLLLTGWLTRAQAGAGWAGGPGRVLLAGIAGFAAGKLLNAGFGFAPHDGMGLSLYPGNLLDFARSLWHEISRQPAVGLLFLVQIALAVRAGSTLRRGQRLSALDWLGLFTLSVLICDLLANWVVGSHPRYMIPVFAWPVILAVAAVTQLPGLWHRAGLAVLAGAALILGAAGTARLVADKGLAFTYYPPEIACIDDALTPTGARAGLSDYWDAKRIPGFSRLDLSLAQHSNELRPSHWITSRAFFHDSYDFALIDETAPEDRKPSEELIRRLNGDPVRRVSCGHRTLLIYAPGGLRVPPGG